MVLGRGFEDMEAVTVIDTIGWTRTRKPLVSIELHTCALHSEVRGKFGIRIYVDHDLRERSFDSSQYDALVVPGGFHTSGLKKFTRRKYMN